MSDDKMKVPRRAYLDGLKTYEPTTTWGTKEDPRQRRWKAQQARYGFDDRQTWSLDTSMVELLYERLQMFLTVADNVVNLDFHKFELDGATYTQRELIEKMIELSEAYLNNDDPDPRVKPAEELWRIWLLVHPVMWW